MKRRTKIVCTLGPAVDTKAKIHELIHAGMNVARINCSHGDWEQRERWIEWIRELSPKVAPVGILADLQGPKFRIGVLESGSMQVKIGQRLSLAQTGSADLTVPNPVIWSSFTVGDRILLGDGDVELRLTARTGDVFESKAVSGGVIKSKQGITVVGRSFDGPCLTEQDKRDAENAAKLGVDFIALSYVRSADDMMELRSLVDSFDPSIQLCAKVETREALKHLDAIIAATDVVMVARGDLGLQMDIREVPIAQKHVIRACNKAGRPVITATQMLESMMHAARPTRAEASDVANAILDGTDAVMLSGETASGEYPILAAQTMGDIAVKAEQLFDHDRWLQQNSPKAKPTTTESVAHAACDLACMLNVTAILTTSSTGATPRMVSKYRPKSPILCATWKPRTQNQLALIWGVEALHVPLQPYLADIIGQTVVEFQQEKLLKFGDTVVVTAGFPAGAPGRTNLVLVHTVA